VKQAKDLEKDPIAKALEKRGLQRKDVTIGAEVVTEIK